MSRAGARPRVAIVGGGFSGIAAAARLKMAGHEAFDVFEQSDGPGGTWHDARYPGAAVDTPQPMYSYSFTETHSFSRVFAGREELLKYLEDTVDEVGIRSHFHFKTRVTSAEWSEKDSAYAVSLSTGETRMYEVLVSAVGYLNNPRYPEWPHLPEFSGAAFHSARWEDVDLAGKRVALVGTGSAACQIAGAIASQVGELLVFQREPGWVLPKADRVFTDEERAELAKPSRRRDLRRRQYLERERGGLEARVGAETKGGWWELVKAASRKPPKSKPVGPQDQAEAYIAEMFASRPDLQAAVTPSYPFGGKRVIKDSTYYPALLRDNVRLIPRAVADAFTGGVIDAEGEKHEVDIMVMATGYLASDYLATLPVKGRKGRWIKDVWNDEPSAFLGVTVPGFPNMFVMYGPNTNSVFLAYLFEAEAAYIQRCVKRIAGGVKTIEVRARWHDEWNRYLEGRLEKTPIARSIRLGVHSYYATKSGRIVGYMPIRNVTYGVLLRLLGRISTKEQR